MARLPQSWLLPAVAFLLFGSVSGSVSGQNQKPPEAAWQPMFDGATLKGWRPAPFTGQGQVRVKDGTIVLGAGSMTGITWTSPFPKTNYEIRFEAARLEGSDFFASITFPVGDRYLSWINGGWGGKVVGLSSLDSNDASENDTSTSRDFENGRWYHFWLAVTDGRVRAWIDEELVIDVNLASREISLRPGEIELSKPLGIASYATTASL